MENSNQQQKEGEMAQNRTFSKGQKDNEKSDDISLYEFAIWFLDDSHIKSLCWTPQLIQMEIRQRKRKQLVNTRWAALMDSDTHEQNEYNHSSEKKEPSLGRSLLTQCLKGFSSWLIGCKITILVYCKNEHLLNKTARSFGKRYPKNLNIINNLIPNKSI